METPTTPVTTISPKYHWGRWLIALLIIVGLLVGIYWYTQSSSSNQNTATDTTTVNDAVAEQLTDISDSTAPSALDQELSDTDLEDVTAELDIISAEAKGL